MINNIATGHLINIYGANEDWVEPIERLYAFSSRLSKFGCQNITLSAQRTIEHEARALRCFDEIGVVSVIRFDLSGIGRFSLYWNGFHQKPYLINNYERGVHLALQSELPKDGNQWVLESIISHILDQKVSIGANVSHRKKKSAYTEASALLPFLLSGKRYDISTPVEFLYVGK